MSINIEVLDIDEDLKVTEEQKERFKIENVEQADWALRVIRKANERLLEVQAMYDKERERIDNWKTKEDNRSLRDIAFMEGLLIEYFENERRRDEKFRLSTPNGKVTSRKSQDKWEFSDETVIEHLKANGLNELVKIEEKIDKRELKKLFTKDGIDVYDTNGEIVKGIKVYSQPDSIKVTVEGV